MGRWLARCGAVLVGFVAALVAVGVAFAHVEVEADPAVAGATHATVTFSAEAESTTAGITSVRIVLPTGIAPGDVALKHAPNGWRLTPGADGYTVAGPALPKGQDAVHSVVVARLPMATSLTFKALVTYADGAVDRWIEEKSASNPNPENPAPVLQLKPGASTSAPAATSTTGATAPSSGTPTLIDDLGAEPPAPTWPWWLGGAGIVVAIVALLAFRRRRPSP